MMKDKLSFGKDASRIIGLILLLSVFYLSLDPSNLPFKDILLFSSNRVYDYKWDFNLTLVCQPFQFKMIDARQKMSVMTKNGKLVNVAVFSTHVLKPGRVHSNVETAILVQHGNLRNGRDYFCNSLSSISSKISDTSSYIVLAPNFLSVNDKCWNDEKNTQSIINLADPNSWCDYQVFSSEGWKDGLSSVNTNKTTEQFYSYDIYNLLIEKLSDRKSFPKLKNITIFGFSAGGQVIMRYAILPRYNLTGGNPPNVRYVISDPSSYFYLDSFRPYQRNGLLDMNKAGPTSLLQYNNPRKKVPYSSSFSFGIPNSTWNNWKIDSNGVEWITNWDDTCSKYNNFRYGFENMFGYFSYHANKAVSVNEFINNVISEFKNRNIIYLAGVNDTENCRWFNHEGCADHSIESHCRAMLQGINRLDRILKWKAYLNFYFKRDVHKIVFVSSGHDERTMVNSIEGQCVIYGLCEVPGVHLNLLESNPST